MKLKNIFQPKWMGITVLLLILIWVWHCRFDRIEYVYNFMFSYYNLTLPASPSKNVLLFSNSKMAGGKHLEYALPILRKFLTPLQVNHVLIVPYAMPSGIGPLLPEIQDTFKKINIEITLLDTTLPAKEQQQLIANAQALYFTGGNTFQLIKSMYDYGVLEIVQDKIHRGTPVIGVSAGTVIHGPTIQTTNDMPVTYPRSFLSLHTAPFQINAHYNTFSPPGFQGETRDDRIKNFLEFNRDAPVVFGLREGAAIHVSGTQGELVGFGTRPGVLLQLDEKGNLLKRGIPVGSRIDNLMNE